MSARKACNAAKNRSPALLPIETSRVALAPKPGVDGSDYINASRMNGHYKQQACTYRASHLVVNLGLVDLDFECCPALTLPLAEVACEV